MLRSDLSSLTPGSASSQETLLRAILSQMPAMVAYWDTDQRCVFANSAYLEWFGKGPEAMKGITMQALLGPLYELNQPYIKKALSGEIQTFERQIKLPNGEIRESIATYTPVLDGQEVQGFYAYVTDVTPIRQREDKLKEAIADTIQILERTKRSFRSKELGQLRARLEELNGGHQEPPVKQSEQGG